MKEHPIIFQPWKIRKIQELKDNETMQTRRVIRMPEGIAAKYEYKGDDGGNELLPKQSGHYWMNGYAMWRPKLCPYGKVGDLLWTKEIWAVGTCADKLKPSELDPPTWLKDNGGLWYKVGLVDPKTPISTRGRWRSGRFMMKWAARIWLENVSIRVERMKGEYYLYADEILESDIVTVRKIIDPWVRVIEFKRIDKPSCAFEVGQ